MQNSTGQRLTTRGLSGARWQLFECDETALHILQQETAEPSLLLRCLLHRGLASAAQIKDFLAPNFAAHRHRKPLRVCARPSPTASEF
jgi:hypothetical protein